MYVTNVLHNFCTLNHFCREEPFHTFAQYSRMMESSSKQSNDEEMEGKKEKDFAPFSKLFR
ncbi:hypothetical protein WN55_01168 [Dufourea novaeangliae]|uniref:Uncharacterized protein n=1 Tax=Dufourea novaeangliae TaxID=178035 RepID=A0A154PE86_DUFNO|nr:hypothetical protein WN55_01168 [Dufourea novaeangliae]